MGIRRVAPIPPIAGIPRSISTTSGRQRSASSTASTPRSLPVHPARSAATFSPLRT